MKTKSLTTSSMTEGFRASVAPLAPGPSNWVRMFALAVGGGKHRIPKSADFTSDLPEGVNGYG